MSLRNQRKQLLNQKYIIPLEADLATEFWLIPCNHSVLLKSRRKNESCPVTRTNRSELGGLETLQTARGPVPRPEEQSSCLESTGSQWLPSTSPFISLSAMFKWDYYIHSIPASITGVATSVIPLISPTCLIIAHGRNEQRNHSNTTAPGRLDDCACAKYQQEGPLGH